MEAESRLRAEKDRLMIKQWVTATLLAATALGSIAPAYAQAQQQQNGGFGGRGGERAGDWSERRGGMQARPAPQGNVAPAARTEDRREWRGERRDDRQEWRGERREDRQDWRNDRRDDRQDWRNEHRDDRRDWREDRRDDRRDWRDDRRDDRRDWRNDNRHRYDWQTERTRQRWEQDRHRWERERQRDAWRDYRWNNDWRNDRRYDWRGYRNSHRHIYRGPAYYAPRGWNYGYRSFSIGVLLWSGLYADRYWINDPYYYRLPPAHGSLRWIRYYDDALLVDVRDGYVVDVIRDFFW